MLKIKPSGFIFSECAIKLYYRKNAVDFIDSFFFFLTELDFNDGGQGGQETDMVISSRKMNSAKAILW